MALAQLAAKKKAKRIIPSFWRVRDVATVNSRWAGRICKLKGFFHTEEGLIVDLEWPNGEHEGFVENKEALPATITDRLAYLAKLAEWERLEAARAEFIKSRDRQNQWITGGEFISVANESRTKVLSMEMEVWAEGADLDYVPESDDAADVFTREKGTPILLLPFAWEKQTSWFSGRVLKTPKKIGGKFLVEFVGGCPGIFSEMGRGLVDWYLVRRLKLRERHAAPSPR